MKLTTTEKRVLRALKDRGSLTTLDTIKDVKQDLLVVTLCELWGSGLVLSETLPDCSKFTLTLRGEHVLESAS